MRLRRMLTSGILGGKVFPSVTLPQNLLSTPHTLIEDFETIGDFTKDAGSTIAADTTHFVHGTQSIQLTAGSGAQGYINKVFGTPVDFSAVACIRIHFYVADNTTMTGITLLMSNSASNYTNGYQVTIGSSSIRNGWNTRSLIKTDFSVMSAGSWSTTFAQMRWRANGATSKVAVVSWDYMTAGVLGTPAAMVMFDDGYLSPYTYTYSSMLTHSIRGTICAISDYVGTSTYMTAAQLTEKYGQGWDICNHSQDSTDLTTLSQADAQTKIRNCKAYLDGQGFTRASALLAYPFGGYNATVKAAATAEGIIGARATTENGTGYEVYPLVDILAINPYGNLTSTRSLATVETAINTAISHGGLIIIYGHKIVTGTPGSEEWKDTDAASLWAYIASKSLPCIIYSELYTLNTEPIVVRLPV
jgi:peptidoglycan/xylan/chitin deacetylase (PgdA/CDA1 family)